MKRYLCLFLVVLSVLTICSCGNSSKNETGTPLDFTVVPADDLPKELLQILETKKAAAFSLTYTDGNFLYIAIGAGKQPTGGYSYQIHGLWLADNVIVIDTELLGPSTDEQAHKVASYPFVVVKLEHREEPVVFK